MCEELSMVNSQAQIRHFLIIVLLLFIAMGSRMIGWEGS